MKKDQIFVSIASYRDPELQHTVDTLIQRADNPDSLNISICQQHYPDQFISFPYPNVRSVNFNHLDSKGVGWARHHASMLYDNEEYFLQIDSHIVMVEHWDTILREQMAIARARTTNKCIFAMYPCGYSIKNGERVYPAAHPLITTIRPAGKEVSKKEWPNAHGQTVNKTGDIVANCPFINAGFMFGDGSFYIDCPYDPDIYFVGEEILNGIKAYTHGYDFFNPSVHMCWHLYKAWNDPNAKEWTVHWNYKDEEQRTIKWTYYSELSREKTAKILRGEIPEVLGTKRSIQEYERYIGYNMTTYEPLNMEEK